MWMARGWRGSLESHQHPKQWVFTSRTSRLGKNESASGMEGSSPVFQEADPRVTDALFVMVTEIKVHLGASRP